MSSTTARIDPSSSDWPTLPAFCRELGISEKLARRERDAGRLKVYRFGDRWERVYRPEGIAWARSKLVQPTNHASARLAEVLRERESRAGVSSG